MATAPAPGTGRRKRVKRSGFRVRLGDDVYTLRKADIGPEDTYMVRRQTGRPFNTFLSDPDTDSIAVIVLLARRKAGERRLTFARVMAEIGELDLEALADNDELDLDFVEDLDADDEQDLLDLDSEEVLPDPLPSAESEPTASR